MTSLSIIAENIAKLQQRIRTAERQYGRIANSVTLMAVSKTRPAAAVETAFQAGIHNIGENYISEAREKQQVLSELDITWHCIGPVQSNKSRLVAEYFDWLHTADRGKIIQRLGEQRPVELAPLNICLQLNIDHEIQKAGISEQDLPALADAVARQPRLRLRGLMCIPSPRDDFAEQRAVFARVRHCYEQLRQYHPEMDTLSMGMSGDFEAAIAEGATIVRIGTELFGARP